jgi:para-aminobenzoate synthetase/4-amino-4-deoxychorismate lyase
VRAALAAAVAGRAGERLRVRLLLAEDGKLTVTAVEQPVQNAGAAMRYVVSDTRLDSANPFLFHKTTRRELYDREWQHYAETVKADEVLYLNERGELAEGSRTNIFIERDGTLLTPPLASGLLPGVLRNELIGSGRAREAVLTLADLDCGDDVYVGNSVRGLVRAEPVTSATS